MVHFLIRKWYTFKLVYTIIHIFLLILGKRANEAEFMLPDLRWKE